MRGVPLLSQVFVVAEVLECGRLGADDGFGVAEGEAGGLVGLAVQQVA